MEISVQLFRKVVQVVILVLAFLGYYGSMRPATVLFLAATLVFGNFFCGWFCPFGTMQEIFGKLGKLIVKRKLKVPYYIQKYLQFLRLVLVAFMLVGVSGLFFSDINAYITFLKSTNFEQIALTAAVIIMLSLLFISIFFERPFCNYLCIEGVKFSILNLPRIFSITRDDCTCSNCGICDRSCPMNIQVSAVNCAVRNMQCINCFECIAKCPKKGTLKFAKYLWWKKKNNTQSGIAKEEQMK